MKKCTRVKNPCKLCLQTVTNKTGVQCKGACKRWAHFTCLNYTPGKIHDIKNGIITITCPCPTCNTAEPKEFLTNPPYTCENDQCPANIMPRCDNTACPTNRGPMNECLPKTSSSTKNQPCTSMVVDKCPSGCLPEGTLTPAQPSQPISIPCPAKNAEISKSHQQQLPCDNYPPQNMKTPSHNNKSDMPRLAPCESQPVKSVIKSIEGPRSPVRELSRQSSSGQRFLTLERRQEKKELTYKDMSDRTSRKRDRKDRSGRRTYSPSSSLGRASPRRSSPRGSPRRSSPRGSPRRSSPRGSPRRSSPRGSPRRSSPRAPSSPSRRTTNSKPSPDRVCCTEGGSPCGGRSKNARRILAKKSGYEGAHSSYDCQGQGQNNYGTSKNSVLSGKTRSCSCLSSPAFSGANIKMDSLGTMNECKKCYSDSAVSLSKESQKALLCTIHELCSTVGHLSNQVKQLMCKMMAGMDAN